MRNYDYPAIKRYFDGKIHLYLFLPRFGFQTGAFIPFLLGICFDGVAFGKSLAYGGGEDIFSERDGGMA